MTAAHRWLAMAIVSFSLSQIVSAPAHSALLEAACRQEILPQGARAGTEPDASLIRATVLHADGRPAKGAIVFGPTGEQATADEQGEVVIDVRPRPDGVVRLNALATIGGTNYSGAAAIDTVESGGDRSVGAIVLHAQQGCAPEWISEFGSEPLNFTVRAMAVFDDGSGAGPQLYVGGSDESVSWAWTPKVAKWTGAAWLMIYSGLENSGNVQSSVFALAVYDNGQGQGPQLYAGGEFEVTNGPVNNGRIARLVGTAWQPVGGGLTINAVRALEVWNDGSGSALYVGGSFTGFLRKWNGVVWTQLGTAPNGPVHCLVAAPSGTVGGSGLYAGGEFTTIGGVAANRVARWSGSSWSAMSSGMNDAVLALAVYIDGASGPRVYAGGAFTTASGAGADRIARWSGAFWQKVGAGVDGTVRALRVHSGLLHVGGEFSTAGGIAANRVAQWNGAAWSALGTGLDAPVYALASANISPVGVALFAGGAFATAIGGPTASHVAAWHNNQWSSMEVAGFNGAVLCSAVFDDGRGGGPSLFVGGFFSEVGGIPVNAIAKWDGRTWSDLDGGVDGGVRCMVVHDDGSGPALFVGGQFGNAGGVSAPSLARWDGTAWSSIGGVDAMIGEGIYALASAGDSGNAGSLLYAAGRFSNIGGIAAKNAAQWDGSAWWPLGSGLSPTFATVSALVVHDDGLGGGPAVYAGGSFTSAGGNSASRIARWDGTGWSSLGTGVGGGEVLALSEFDDGLGDGPALYAGGRFTTAGGISASGIARWNGMAWNSLGAGLSGAPSVVQAAALHTFDDGTGSGRALYVGGEFTMAGATAANHLARWDGASWSSLGMTAVTMGPAPVWTLVGCEQTNSIGPSLYVGGWYSGGPAGDSYLSRLQTCPIDEGNPADFNGDGVVDGDDLGTLLGYWGPCPAPCPPDLNGDGIVDGDDLGTLLGQWG